MNKLKQICWHILCCVAPKTAVKIQYKHIMGVEIDFKNPRDLNEKINYLKFHADIDNDSVVNRLQEIVLDGDDVRSSMKTAHNIDFFDESHRMRGRLIRSRIPGRI